MPGTQEYHSGGEGIVLMGTVDYNASGCTLTPTVADTDITTTADYDAVDKFLYENVQGVRRSASGEVSIFWDALNQPTPALREGAIIAINVVFPGGKHFDCPKALVSSIPLDTGGMTGVYSVKVNWKSKGKYTFA